ncbi:MAG: Ig-like domain-containing protein, partial [Clostridia bacterium]
MKKLISVVLALTMVLALVPAFSVGAENINEGLVLHYSFNNDGSAPLAITDDSGNGYDAAVLNTSQNVNMGGGQTATYTKNLSIENGTAFFPGMEKVTSGRRSTLVNGAAIKIPAEAVQGISDFTVSVWVKADGEYAYSGNLQRFFDFGNISGGNAYNSIFARYTPSTGLLRIQDRGGSSSSDSGIYREATLSDKSFTDKWGLLTVTFEYDGEKYYKLKTYVNGVFQGDLSPDALFTRSLKDLGEMDDSSNGLFIGRTVWAATNQNVEDNPDFCGWMDDFRLYNRTLSAAEIALIYETTNPESEKIPMSAENPKETVTLAGNAPSLPSTVKVNYTNGSSENLSVVWEEIPADKYAAEGSFTVKGSVDGTSLTVTAVVKVVANPKESINSGLAAYYSFEEDAAEPTYIKDMSGNGNNAAVLNTVQSGGWTGNVSNKIKIEDGKAVFPGFTKTVFEDWGGFSITNTGAALKLPNEFNQGIGDYTVSMWINADGEYEFADGYQRFFDLGNRGDGTDYYNSLFARYSISENKLRFYDRKLSKTIEADASDKPFTDKWGQLTVVGNKAEGSVMVYINGELAVSGSGFTRGLDDLGTLNDTSNGLFIGRTQWYSNSSEIDNNPDFKGKMDEVRIYNRALAEAEVKALYTCTNPERKIEITIDIYCLDENLIEQYHKTETAEAAENSVFSVNPDDYSFNDGSVPYVFSAALSKAKIDKVTENDCTITLYYALIKAVSAEAQSVETYKGSAPELPKQVEVTYKTGDKAMADVTWEAVPSESYSEIGTFTVNGTAEGLPVTATVTVYEIISAEVSENVYTSFGEAPVLPSTAKVEYSHKPGEIFYEPVVWDEITD